MFDAATAGYRTCARGRGGECLEFSAACEPSGACMIDPRDRMHRVCERSAGGKCQRFGALCTPPP